MDKRTIMTLLLGFLALALWHGYVAPLIWPPQQEQQEQQEQQQQSEPAPTQPQTRQPKQPELAPRDETKAPPPPIDPDEEKEVIPTTIANDKLTLKLTNVGATIEEAYLRDFHRDLDRKQRLRLLAPIVSGRRSLGLEIKGSADLANKKWKVIDSGKDSVTYQANATDSLRVTKKISLPSGANHALLEIKLENLSSDEKKHSYWLTSAAGIVPDLPEWQLDDTQLSELGSSYIEGAIGVSSGRNGDGVNILRRGPGKVQDEPFVETGNTLWAGVKNRYFSAVVKPDNPGTVVAGRVSAVGERNVSAALESRVITLPRQTSQTDEYLFFVGPNSPHVRAVPEYQDFVNIHKVPSPAAITNFFIAILHAFYSVARNYGVAIIMLTLLVRVALHPLTRKSQKSMANMGKLSPKMKEIKSKYKDDKKRQQEEMMKLYREHGVNPMGGCLPIILQLPILIGLFGALRYAIELRHEPFLLWINDLSQPDALTMLPASLPFVGGMPLNVLPILLIAAMFFQQKFTPRPMSADPQAEQTQKMMMWMMPAMFGFLFYGMPSGLVLYFMTSTGLGAFESHLIRRHIAKLEEQPTKKTEKKKRESWVDRSAKAKTNRRRKLR